jgi:hypothetical protein
VFLIDPPRFAGLSAKNIELPEISFQLESTVWAPGGLGASEFSRAKTRDQGLAEMIEVATVPHTQHHVRPTFAIGMFTDVIARRRC